MDKKFKNFNEIMRTMVDRILIETNKITDFSVGSTIRSLLETVAFEVNQLYVLSRSNIKKGIEEGLYEAFDFKKKEAVKAYGNVIIAFHNPPKKDVVIPKGTRFICRDSRYTQTYETIQSYIIPEGQAYNTVEVFCMIEGSIGNVPKGVINTITSNIYDIAYVYNPDDILTGQDEEPIEEVKERFQYFVETRARATNKALMFAIKQIPYVSSVYIDEAVGWTKVYVSDNNGRLPGWLREQVEKTVEDYRASGIRVTVEDVKRVPVDFNIDVVLADSRLMNINLKNDLEKLVRDTVNNLQIGETLVLSDITNKIKSLDNRAIYDVIILTPEANYEVKQHELIRAGENVKINLKMKPERTPDSSERFDV